MSDADASSGWCGKGKPSASSYCRRLNATSRQRNGSSFQLWSPRLKQRDERKRVLKMSLAKLRRIDDAESCLRRSVLLNNTLRRLQREVRDEKASAMDRLQQHWPEADYVVVDSRLEHPAAPVRLDPVAKSLLSCDELPGLDCEDENSAAPRPAAIKRRRSASSEDDDAADVHLPAPAPRLIASLDADDDVVDVVSEDGAESWPAKKRKLTDEPEVAGSDVAARSRPALRPCNGLPSSQQSAASPSSPYSLTNQNASPPTLVSGYATSSGASSQAASYSCGQSSLFGELQSVVFHSLITSLES